MPNFKADQIAWRKDTNEPVRIVRVLDSGSGYLVEHQTDWHTAIVDDSQLWPRNADRDRREVTRLMGEVAALIEVLQARVAGAPTDLAGWSVIHNQLRDALRQVRRLMSHLDK